MFLRLSDVNDAKSLSLGARCIQNTYFREVRLFVLFREVFEKGSTQDNKTTQADNLLEKHYYINLYTLSEKVRNF